MNWRAYHELTKHTPEKLRESRHVLDWANRPDPFRHYEGVPVLDLPADAPFASTTGAEFLSWLLFHSAAISAAKRVPGSGEKYALRVNPSSGNLHPTEFHFVTQGLREWPDGLYHYRPSSHMAEQRGVGPFALPAGGPVAFLLSTIVWREAWKYQERAYRYCLLDIGHAAEALVQAARVLGCEATVVSDFPADTVALAGDELPMLVIGLRGLSIPLASAPVLTGGVPNELSAHRIDCPVVADVEKAGTATLIADPQRFTRAARRRRSALDFQGGERGLSAEEFSTLLAAARPPALLQLYFFVHRVEGVARGLYRFGASGLELMKAGDQRVMAAALSLSQELAGNSCFTVSMIADLAFAERVYGEVGYRVAHFEAGAVGQRLYLAATDLGFGATGIGAFYDDAVHEYLGLTSGDGQVVYHFAVGYPVEDPRLIATSDESVEK